MPDRLTPEQEADLAAMFEDVNSILDEAIERGVSPEVVIQERDAAEQCAIRARSQDDE